MDRGGARGLILESNSAGRGLRPARQRVSSRQLRADHSAWLTERALATRIGHGSFHQHAEILDVERLRENVDAFVD